MLKVFILFILLIAGVVLGPMIGQRNSPNLFNFKSSNSIMCLLINSN